MKILENILLAPHTTFKIGGPAKYFCVVKDQFDALEAYELAREKNLKVFVLGGGSNVLISDEGFNGLVIKVENKGVEVLHEDQSSIILKIASGENWDEVVKFAVKNNWWGIENLSHIPGSTGAIAVQNVGAYGQEANNIIKSLTVFDRETRQILELDNASCGFSYRKSIFNTKSKGKYIIFYITLRLSKIPEPILSYRDLKERFGSPNTLSVPPLAGHLPQKGENNIALSLPQIREAIISIRDKKYPFPTEAKKGNAGSFFKNPVLDEIDFKDLKVRIASIFGEERAGILESKVFRSPFSSPSGGEGEGGGEIKIPAAFLMELCGLKDLKEGGAKINHNQPLVIINETGTAAAKDVLNLAQKVMNTVYEKTGIRLQTEPELIGFSKKELTGII